MVNYKAEYILVRYGELSTKGKNRKIFVAKLIERIRQRLHAFPALKVSYDYNRIYIALHDEDENAVCEALKDVFGIASYSVAVKCENAIENLCEAAVELMKEVPLTRFKVESRRQVKTYPMMSTQISAEIGHAIVTQTEHVVDVHHPDLLVRVEVQENFAYLTVKTFKGAGGYPVGIGGKALLMLSGGIDSPVAGYQTMKRGVEIEAIHFAAPPYTSDQAKDKVLKLAQLLSPHQGRITVHIVPFTEIQMEIYKNCDTQYAVTLMRRMMYRIAESVAHNRRALALVCGDSLGQVASQTLQSMQVINDAIEMLVLRPLITFDKLEIIDQAIKIGTYETSILPYEDCCTIFGVTNPSTKPRTHFVEKEEARFDFQPMIETAIANIQTLIVTPQAENDDLF